MYDVLILGGGPGGYVAAIKAAQMGAKVGLVEKDKLGGTCLHCGCIPSKTLLSSAELALSIRNADSYGLHVETPDISFPDMMKRKDKVVRTLESGIKHLMKANGIEVISGEGQLAGKTAVTVKGDPIEYQNLVIAVGSSPVRIPVPGADGDHVITSDEVFRLKTRPDSLAIIGGGVIGVEMACLFQNIGTKVTVIEMLDRLVPLMDSALSGVLKKMLEKQGITVKTSARVTSLENHAVQFETGDKTETVQADKVLMVVGRRSNGAQLELDTLGIRHEKGVIQTDDRLQTNVPGVFAIGDVNGKFMLAHTASREGIVAVHNALGREARMSYAAIPQCVYTIPEELAAVGLTEQEAVEAGQKTTVKQYPLAANGKALASGHAAGFVKLISGQDGEILGAHMMAPHATDLIGALTVSKSWELTSLEIAETIWPHPTLSEVIGEVAHMVEGSPLHAVG